MVGSVGILSTMTLPSMIYVGAALNGWVVTYSDIVDSGLIVGLSVVKERDLVSYSSMPN